MSSAIANIEYNEESGVLKVSFVKGGTWSFSGVDKETAEAFKSASSQGSYFNVVIKGKYSYVKE